jgi:uncharacterized LabA/DUF88 family protein
MPIALVDYDNVSRLYREQGLAAVAQRIVDFAGHGIFDTERRLHLRLYGGWYTGTNSTRRAQSLAAEIARFPSSAVSVGQHENIELIVTAELAISTLDEPRVPLTHTFRQRTGVQGLGCRTSPVQGCVAAAGCPLTMITPFIRRDECLADNCFVQPIDVFTRDEQKLVDTMLVTDLLSLARKQHEGVILVSNDDDMLPGIRVALQWGLDIVHIHPVPGRATPPHYLRSMSAGYRQATMG